jgi:hypothetical protein
VDALIATAPAQIAGHAAGDVGVGRRRLLGEQRRRIHDLAGLAIAALRHAEVAPGDLHGVLALGVQALDGDDRLGCRRRHRRRAGADRIAVEMHGAVAAERGTAAELGAGEAQLVAQVPQDRHRRIAVVGPLLSVYP